MGTLERGRPVTDAELARRADWIRPQTVELIAQAGLGHYASTFSCAEIVATLYYHALRLRPFEPSWPDRDRFLLGKGHAAETIAARRLTAALDTAALPAEDLEVGVPADLYEHYGLTAAGIAAKALDLTRR